MKKLVLAIIISSIYNLASAGNYVTTGNSDNWNNPAAWDCNCVPDLINDNVSINHALVRNGTLSPQNSNINVNNTLKINGSLQFFNAVNFNVSTTGFLEVNNMTINSLSALINFSADVQVNNNLQLMNGYNLNITKTVTANNLDISGGSKITGSGKLSWSILQLTTGGSIVCSSGTTFTQANPPSGNSLDLGGCTPLPVRFVSVQSVKNEKGITVYWTTSMEKNNAYFSIEKSADGEVFYSIGIVEGVGNSSSLKNYHFNDNEEIGKIVYYRIKQVDVDGNYEYSDLISVNGNEQNVIQIKNKTAIVSVSGYTHVQIISAKGEVLMQQTYDSEGQKEIYIDLDKGYKGINILKVVTAGNNYSQRF